ncbi:DNA-directed RNA polymerase sigma-70 factor [Algimonas ampicilliniresistens]|uniref:DNA-directed RNA polymerase sigma-70 factor n=1 Tax=Algimonas ampicilliniresistens TaxID=1298735 RepID=A0ABQ5VAR2_9PROT|nr:sigma-70 family RNA polymerase sigma factor [Algimonas ampicilliniresistens]GLQ24604.1 DNA-directed RNA polymerase sigma-70 factor [Algimonas ampicilliniresistens]
MSSVVQDVAADEEVPVFDEEVFRQELTALIPHLRAFSRSLCGNATLADDVAQDALLKAWKARHKFRPGSNLKAWTFTILRNQFYSIKRRSWRATSLEPEVAEQTIVANTDAEQSVHLNELRRGLDMLKDDQREALILVGASGLSYEEAAEICDCAVGTIKSRVSRARKSLETIMDSGRFDDEPDKVRALDAMSTILQEADTIAGKP